MRTLTVLIALSLLARAALAESPRSLDEYGGPDRLTISQSVPVAIPDSERIRVDAVERPRSRDNIRVITGPYWAKIFAGNPGANALFEILDAKVVEASAGGGFATRATYSIRGVLKFDGRSVPIYAEGSKASAESHMKAVNAAVQLGILDAAAKVTLAIESQSRSPSGLDLPQAENRASPDTLLILNNGAEVRGTFVEMKDTKYFLRLPDGRTMSYSVSDVERVERLSVSAPGDLTAPTPHPPMVGGSICRVFVTEQLLGSELYVPIKKIQTAKKWYGSVRDAYEALANVARELDADAVIESRQWFAPSGFSWAAPKASGLAIKWTDAGRQAFPTLVGRCY